MPMEPQPSDSDPTSAANLGARRPVAARDSSLIRRIAAGLAQARVRPNAISAASVVFAAGSAALMILAARLVVPGAIAAYIVAAVFVQARLLCNLLDGLVAVENGLGSKTGDIVNDFPDRVSDAVTLAAAGYAALPLLSYQPILGWIAALMAVLTAYMRVLGGSAGAKQYFVGPMAKQMRMNIVTLACLGAALEQPFHQRFPVFAVALAVVIVGCAATIYNRTKLVVGDLESR